MRKAADLSDLKSIFIPRAICGGCGTVKDGAKETHLPCAICINARNYLKSMVAGRDLHLAVNAKELWEVAVLFGKVSQSEWKDIEQGAEA